METFDNTSSEERKRAKEKNDRFAEKLNFSPDQKAQMDKAFDVLWQNMENEDPYATIYCS